MFANSQQPEATLSVDFGEGPSELFKQLADRYLRGAVEARRDGTPHSDVDVLYPDMYEQDGTDDSTVNELGWRTFGIDQLDQQRLDDADALDAVCDNPGQHPEDRILAAMRALNALSQMLASRNPDVPVDTHPASLESEWEQGPARDAESSATEQCLPVCKQSVSDSCQHQTQINTPFHSEGGVAVWCSMTCRVCANVDGLGEVESGSGTIRCPDSGPAGWRRRFSLRYLTAKLLMLCQAFAAGCAGSSAATRRTVFAGSTL